MSIRYVGFSVAKPGQDIALKQFIETEVMPAVIRSEGCISCQLLQGIEDSHQFTVIEVWESLEMHKASIKNISRDAITRFMELVAEPPKGSHYRLLTAL